MATERIRVTVEEVAADPTNAYEITVHGDVAIESLSIHGTGHNAWTKTQYANGGSSAGTPAHWHQYVRYVETDDTEEEIPPCAESFTVGELVSFQSSEQDVTGTNGTVTRVWRNGVNLTIRRNSDGATFVRDARVVWHLTPIHLTSEPKPLPVPSVFLNVQQCVMAGTPSAHIPHIFPTVYATREDAEKNRPNNLPDAIVWETVEFAPVPF